MSKSYLTLIDLLHTSLTGKSLMTEQNLNLFRIESFTKKKDFSINKLLSIRTTLMFLTNFY